MPIRTILWQSFADFELIVVGDGCTDDTEEVVAAFRDQRIRWCNLTTNCGNQAAPNNAGLDLARGKYIAYMHQDDLWLPNHLETLVNGMETSNVAMAHTLCLQMSLTAQDSPERIRIVMGLPNTGYIGGEKRAIYTTAIMHGREKAISINGWKDWRALHKATYVDFIERLIGEEQSMKSLSQVTVIKFNSAERHGSYIEKRCDEQAHYFRRIQEESDFLNQELILAIERMLQIIQVLPPRTGLEPSGWEIAKYRKIRGLDPMLSI
jgi:glycosyltransferase involved in cell wall biosynthesis